MSTNALAGAQIQLSPLPTVVVHNNSSTPSISWCGSQSPLIRSVRKAQWWRLLRRLAELFLVLLLVLCLVLFLRAWLVPRPGPPKNLLKALPPAGTCKGIDDGKHEERAKRLAEALKIPTISYGPGNQSEIALLQLREYLEKTYPLLHNTAWINRTVVNNFSLLYEVQGSGEADKMRPPYLLAAHMDVVPANDPHLWDAPPFGGLIVNGTYIYGRGAMDHKGGVIGILEALERRVEQRERPLRTFYIAFGHDEEIHGYNGAKQIAIELSKRGVHELDFVHDEGTPVLKGAIPGTDRPVAAIGVTEKGYTTLELTVTQPPGHSSFPPRQTAIGILSAAIQRLESHPQPCMFGTGAERALFEFIAPDLTFYLRVVLSNMWLFSGLVVRMLSNNPKMDAMMRTTTAVTIIRGGEKENVLPGSARAVVNHRIHPSQSIEEVMKHDQDVINDPRVNITIKTAIKAHPVTPYNQSAVPFHMFAATVKDTFPEAIVAPAVMIANTDTVWYLNHTSHVLRFLPAVLTNEDTARYHGLNERLSVRDFQKVADFYYRLICNADALANFSSAVTASADL